VIKEKREADSLRDPKRRRICFLVALVCLTIILASPALASAESLRRREIQCTVEGAYKSAIIEGEVVDIDTGGPVAGAVVSAGIDSGLKLIEAVTDANGHFLIGIENTGDHDYDIQVSAVGYDPARVTGSIRSGEQKHLTIKVKYNPFDLRLSDSYGTLSRGYTAYSYSGRRSVPFTAQRIVPVLDRLGNPVYDTVVEKVLAGYTWEERVTLYRTEYYTMPTTILVPRYRTETYLSGWKMVKLGWFSFPVPVFSTRTVFDGYTTRIVLQTFTRQVPYEDWVLKSSPTKPDFLILGSLPSDRIRNVKEVYDFIIKKVPRTQVETYTAYRIYDYGGEYYSYLPWSSIGTTVIVTMKNGYSGGVFLSAASGGDLELRLGSTVLRGSTTMTTTLTMTPRQAATYSIAVKAFDSRGRLIETCIYWLNAVESLPQPNVWEKYVETALVPDQIPPTITTVKTHTENVEFNQSTVYSALLTGKLCGPRYDGGTVGGPMTQFWTVNYMQPVRPDGTMNYINQKAWEQVYDVKIVSQGIINPNNS
jgi:hypothetical protein